MQIQKSFGAPPAGVRKTGTLYLVGTPIGNLEDITFRAVRILKEADWIAAEDTRQTRKLLNHFEISTRMISYHEHNKAESGAHLVDKLLAGESIALVSDAGLPAISDPGADLVRLAVEQNIPVVPIPGANAALSALIISGLDTTDFRFAGFLPRSKKELTAALQMLKDEPATLIFYEAPHRVKKTLTALAEVFADRPMAMIRELTKKHEEAARGTVAEMLRHAEEQEPRGEYCLVIAGAGAAGEADAGTAWWEDLTVEAHVEHYEEEGHPRKEAMRLAAGDRGIAKRDIYNSLLKEEP